MVRAFRRSLMGGSNVNKPSRFLDDIPSDLLSRGQPWQGEEKRIADSITSWGSKTLSKSELPQLKPGDHVRHAVFGEGVVVSYREVNDDSEVGVAFKKSGIKKLLLSYAKLEKL